MAFRRRSGSSWVTPSNIRRRSGSSWVVINSVRRRSGSSWITVYTSYTAPSGSIPTISATHRDPTLSRPPPTFQVGGSGRVNVTGGTGNYTYRWSIVSGGASITGGTTGVGVSVTATVPNFSTVSGTVRCVVSDGVSSVTINGTYRLTYEGGQPI